MSDARIDNLRHLRFVHFALIVVSILMLIASSFDPPAPLAAALRQAKLLADRADRLIDRADQLHELTCAATLKDLLGRYQASSPSLGEPRRLAFEVRLDEVDDALLAARRDRFRAQGTRRLGDLAAIWNAFDAAQTRYTITHVEDLVGLYAVHTVTQPDAASGGYPSEEHEQLFIARGRYDQPNRALGDIVFGEVRRAGDRDGFELAVRRMSFYDEPSGTRWDVSFDEPLVSALTIERVGDVQAGLIDDLDLPCGPGSFQASFPELASISTGLASLDIGALVNHLADRAAAEGGRVDLLLGSMPIGMLRLWGALLLCIVQIYFAMHLSHHRAAVAAALDAGAFPWVATYRSFAPQVATITTTVVLPAGVVLYAVAMGVGAPGSAGTVTAWVVAATSLAAAAATFACFLRIHRDEARHHEP